MACNATKMVQVRNVPDDVHAELRRRAAAAGMSLSDFARQELSRLVRRPSVADRNTFAEARAAVVAERPDA